MTKKFIVPYVVASLAMAAAISVASSDGAVVARSYSGYNNQKPSVAADYTYQTVGVPWNNTYVEVTATQAREIKDGIVIFAYPRCPYCRNLIPELTSIAKEKNQTVYYCKIDEYRDIYAYDENTGAPVMTKAAGEGYDELLNWLQDYLADYTISDKDKNKYEIGEKRIGAPTIVRIEEGEPVSTWKLSSVEDVSYPENKYDSWDDTVRVKVSDSLRDYFEEA